jgi:hypothetical protein
MIRLSIRKSTEGEEQSMTRLQHLRQTAFLNRQQLSLVFKKLSQKSAWGLSRATIGTSMCFHALTPTLSQMEREHFGGVSQFPLPLGEGHRVRVFVLRFRPFHKF